MTRRILCLHGVCRCEERICVFPRCAVRGVHFRWWVAIRFWPGSGLEVVVSDSLPFQRWVSKGGFSFGRKQCDASKSGICGGLRGKMGSSVTCFHIPDDAVYVLKHTRQKRKKRKTAKCRFSSIAKQCCILRFFLGKDVLSSKWNEHLQCLNGGCSFPNLWVLFQTWAQCASK